MDQLKKVNNYFAEIQHNIEIKKITILKTKNLLLYLICIWTWRSEKAANKNPFFWVPIYEQN